MFFDIIGHADITQVKLNYPDDTEHLIFIGEL